MENNYTLEELLEELKSLEEYKRETEMKLKEIRGGISVNRKDRYRMLNRDFIPGDNADLENAEIDLRRQQRIEKEINVLLINIKTEIKRVKEEITELETKLEKA